jgi:hypothetical protein
LDEDSYNGSRPKDESIQIVFDFTMGLAELEAADEPPLSSAGARPFCENINYGTPTSTRVSRRRARPVGGKCVSNVLGPGSAVATDRMPSPDLKRQRSCQCHWNVG